MLPVLTFSFIKNALNERFVFPTSFIINKQSFVVDKTFDNVT